MKLGHALPHIPVNVHQSSRVHPITLLTLVGAAVWVLWALEWSAVNASGWQRWFCQISGLRPSAGPDPGVTNTDHRFRPVRSLAAKARKSALRPEI